MRPALVPVAVACATLALGGCITSSSRHPGRVETTSQAERDSVTGAVSAPLRDFNLLRTKIPSVLLEAMADPYYRPGGRLTCSDIVAMVVPLDIALGPDLDAPPPAKEGLTQRGRGATLSAVAGATAGVIPFHSWIRKLTGAEQHDDYVQSAIKAGSVRRAYLKGLGEAKGCPPPATPSHLTTGKPVIDQSLRPRYPTHLPVARGPDGGTPPVDPPQ
ncbi:MAG: hypothetical protein KGO51_15910 [Alphaproteobacteria bacterium]|nr:hypothetical protein [Alphaproteobacteria bacterium]